MEGLIDSFGVAGGSGEGEGGGVGTGFEVAGLGAAEGAVAGVVEGGEEGHECHGLGVISIVNVVAVSESGFGMLVSTVEMG